MDWHNLFELSKKQEGRESLLSRQDELVPLLRAAFVHFIEEGHVISYIQFHQRLVLLRNFCISDNLYVGCIVEEQILNPLLLLCRYLSLSSGLSSEEDLASTLLEEDLYSFVLTYPEEYKRKITRTIAQILVNISNCSTAAATYILNQHLLQRHEERHRGSISDIISISMLLKEQSSLEAIWVMITTLISVAANSEFPLSFTDIMSFTTAKSVFKQLMLSLHSHANRKVDDIGSKMCTEGSSEGCQLFTMSLIREKISHLRSFYTALGPEVHGESKDFPVNLEQVLFLFVFISVLEEDGESKCNFVAAQHFTEVREFLLLVAHQLSSALSICLTQPENEVSGERDISTEFRATVYSDLAIVALHILGSALCLFDEFIHDKSQDQLSIKSCIAYISDFKSEISRLLIGSLFQNILLNRDPVTKRTFDPQRRSSIIDEVDQEVDKSVLWIREMIRRSLQLLSLLVIHSSDSQKVLLDYPGLLGSLLQHCATDFENPLAREWALLVVRNLCEESDEARTRIDALRPQEVIRLSGSSKIESTECRTDEDLLQEEAFRKSGLSVSLDPQTGKLIVERDDEVDRKK